MGLTTFATVVLGTIAIAAVRGHAAPTMIASIIAYNLAGLALGYILSINAK